MAKYLSGLRLGLPLPYLLPSLNWLFNLHNPFVDGATAMIQNPFQSGFLVAINASPADACAGHGSPPINVSKCFADNA